MRQIQHPTTDELLGFSLERWVLKRLLFCSLWIFLRSFSAAFCFYCERKKSVLTSARGFAGGFIHGFLISGLFTFSGEALELSEQYTGTGTPDIVTLRHPNTGESAVFLFSPANNSVQEILTYNEAKRSWFIDETVKSDGKMHLSTPIDPIFLGKNQL